jgi:LPXTG-motif cell wall-anchored protein
MIGLRTRIVALAAVVGAAAAVALVGPAAAAQTLPLTYDLGVVLPGESRTVEREIEIPRHVSVTAASFASTASDDAWDAQLCADRCIAVDDLTGETLSAGEYRLIVTLTMPADGAITLESSARGSLTLIDAAAGVGGTETLPSTGGSLPVASMAVGAALAAGGALLLLSGRRRARRQEVAS